MYIFSYVKHNIHAGRERNAMQIPGTFLSDAHATCAHATCALV